MKHKKWVASLIGLVFFGIVAVAGAAEVQKYNFGSGPMGGLWRIGVGGAVQLLNDTYKDKYFYTAASSGGGVENVRRMVGGEFDTAWAQINVMEEVWTGKGMFAGQKPYRDMRGIIFIGDQAISVITLAKSPIKTFSDMVGKKINIGPPGSAGVPIAKEIFKALGIEDKVKLSYLNPEGTAQGLKDGHIDVGISPGDPLNSACVELARSVTIRIIEPTEAENQKIEKGVSYLDLKMIPPNTAPGENADKPRKAYFWGTHWVAKVSMPAQAVYDALKVTQEPKNKEMLTKVLSLWGQSGPEFKMLVKVGIPLHAGAIRYWQEKGVKLAPELLK
jgi:uncharacterized protein